MSKKHWIDTRIEIRMSSLDVQASVLDLFRAFVRGGATEVYLSSCCGRVYVGSMAPKSCRTCSNTPQVTRVTTEEEVRAWVKSLSVTP